ncbi:MAG: RDD family protein [Candidatus Nanopelagicaceae bacterium]
MTGLLQPCFESPWQGDAGYHVGVSMGDGQMDGPSVGRLAGMGRRFIAITLDWLMSWAFGSLVFEQSEGRAFWIPAVFFVEIVLFTWLTGSSAGQRMVGLTVRGYPDLAPLSLVKVIIRTTLILLVIPAVVFDSDGRGLHDRIASSAVFRKAGSA